MRDPRVGLGRVSGFPGGVSHVDYLRPPRQGQAFERELFTATLEEMTRSGADVRAVSFSLRLPLDDPSLLFLHWDGEAFRPIDLASLPVQAERILADTSDPWAGMW